MRVYISFDFDRTLADYSKAHGNGILAGIHETFDKKFQVSFSDLSCSGLTDLQIITNLAHNHGVSYHTIFEQMDQCQRNIVKNFNTYSQIYPIELLRDAKETIENFSCIDNVIIGISTGNIRPISLKKIKLTGLEEYFSFGSFGNEVFTRYQLLRLTKNRLIKNFGFSNKDIAIHVGDAVLDILSAKNAGFIPIGVSTGSYSKEQLLKAGARYVFEQISDVYDSFDIIVGEIQNKKKFAEILV